MTLAEYLGLADSVMMCCGSENPARGEPVKVASIGGSTWRCTCFSSSES